MQAILLRLKTVLQYMGVLQATFFVLFGLYIFSTFAPHTHWLKEVSSESADTSNPEFYVFIGLAISLLMLFVFKYDNLLNTVLNIVFVRLNMLLFAIYNTVSNS